MERARIAAAWVNPAAPVSCLVYGQGVCEPEAPYYVHYQKRTVIRDFLRGLGVDAVFPEEVLDEADADPLWAQLGLARERDFVVAIQPPEPQKGPPTLKMEVAEIFW